MIYIVIEPTHLTHGLYKIHWVDGGTSEASVGRDRNGKVWFAPVNWTNVPSFDWDKVEGVEKVEASKE